ncbi:MAG TPA: hypothetical protein ENK20_05120 [Chromatiales bacterium]|nr:hypothetical protein [Chromatiales bacterium]
MRRPLHLLLALTLALAAAGCGQKGDLYLPERETPPAEGR